MTGQGSMRPEREVVETFVVVGEGSDELVTTLEDLARHHVVRPFVLVHPRWTRRLDVTGADDVDLDNELATGQRPLVRLVAVRSLHPAPPEQYEWENRLRATLERRSNDLGVRFVSGILSAAATGADVSACEFVPLWHFNLVMVPEDGAGQIGYFTRPLRPDLVTPALVSCLALVGALWRWLAVGPLDEQRTENTAMRWVQPARCYTRIIDAGDLAAHAIDLALDAGDVWPPPRGLRHHGRPDLAVNQLAIDVAEAPEVGFAYRTLVPPSERSVLGWWTALKLFFRQLGDYLVSRPPAWAEEIRTRVIAEAEKALQNATFGKDSEVVISLRHGARDVQMITSAEHRIARMQELPGVSLPARVATPQTWAIIRSVVFGAADGGPLLGGVADIPLIWEHKRAIVDDVAKLGPSPVGSGGASAAFLLSAEDLRSIGITSAEPLVIGACDPIVARLVERALQGLGSVASLPAPTLPPPPPPPPPQSTPTSEPVPTESPESPDDVEDVSPVEVTPAAVRTGGSLHDRLMRWRAERSSSMLWMVGERLADAVDRALDDFTRTEIELEEATAQMRAQADVVHTGRQKLRRSTIACVASLLLLAGAGAAWAYVASGFMFAVIVLGAIVLGLLIRVVSRAVAHVRNEERLRVLARRPQFLWNLRVHASSEYARLSSLGDQFADWADVLCMVLHHPWGTTGSVEESVEPWTTSSPILMFNSALAEIDEPELQSEIFRLRGSLVHLGWMTALYGELFEAWQRRYSVLARNLSGGDVPPESDASGDDRPIGEIRQSGERVLRPRRQLSHDVVQGRDAAVLRVRMIERLRGVFGEQDPARLIGGIRTDEAGLSSQTPQDFLGCVAGHPSPPPFDHDYIDHTITGRPRSVEHSYFGASEGVPGVPAADEELGANRSRMAIVDLPDRYLLAAVRLDLGAAFPPAELSFVTACASDDDNGDESADGVEVKG